MFLGGERPCLSVVLVSCLGFATHLRFVLSFLLCLLTLNAWAVNKCKGADEKTVFQDSPWTGKLLNAAKNSRNLPVASPIFEFAKTTCERIKCIPAVQ